jgi:hypothetical protein
MNIRAVTKSVTTFKDKIGYHSDPLPTQRSAVYTHGSGNWHWKARPNMENMAQTAMTAVVMRHVRWSLLCGLSLVIRSKTDSFANAITVMARMWLE